MKIWDNIKGKNLLKKDLPPPIPLALETGLTEEFDLKSLKVPGSSVDHFGYYIFCKDPKAKEDKTFLYYKKVISFERSLEDAKQMINLMNTKYSIIALKYNFKTECVENCHEGESAFYKEQIVQFEKLKRDSSQLLHLGFKKN